MSPHSFSTTAAYSPALLALKRFVRGTLRQFGTAAVSLMAILSISTHSVAGALPNGGDFNAESFHPPASTIHLRPQGTLSSPSEATIQPVEPSAAASASSFPSFRSRMLRHRVTSARLSIPESRERAIASLLSEAE